MMKVYTSHLTDLLSSNYYQAIIVNQISKAKPTVE